jgi:hypothetical protein
MRNQRVRTPGGLKENMRELLPEDLREENVYLTGATGWTT